MFIVTFSFTVISLRYNIHVCFNFTSVYSLPLSVSLSLSLLRALQLTDEERVYLNAAAVGDVPVLRQSLEDSEVTLNVNCVDYMGRSALHLAIDNENTESIELLLDKLNFESIDESLLHAISKGSIKTVKMIIEHPSYMAGEDKVRRKGVSDPFFRTEEKSQFSPDITPLILSAHYNNHEIIQMFLSRNQTIERPHPISCQCRDCVIKQNYDSLKRSRSRLNAYRALASPAFMALSSRDPIMATFELRQEMKKLAQVEKEFQNEYLALVEQCMDFACELMDLCRGTQEVEAVLGEGSDETGTRDPLARLKMAMEYEEKKFVAHPNCQQHLTSIWYGPEMGFMQSMGTGKKIFMWIGCIPLVPFICLVYLGNALRCPATKFISHTLSHICFLVLLTAATFRVDQPTIYPITSSDDFDHSKYEHLSYAEKAENVLRTHFRPANVLMCKVQLCLMFWVIGLLWMECKQMYNSGLRVYLLDNYNSIDYAVLSLYLASYTLRFLVDYKVAVADVYYNGTARARQALMDYNNISFFDGIRDEIFNDVTQPTYSYFMRASRFYWRPDDPEIVADVLFAMANVLSIARTTYLMPAFEVLGPLQIALGRMIGDITRFLVLFTLVVFAFMVGLHNIYWYYGSQTYHKQMEDGTTKLTHSTEAFQGMAHTLFSLFWSMFGLVNINSVLVTYPEKQAITEKSASDGTSLVEGVGMFLFAFYHVVIIIVLVNMLIAMMSHSFEDIQQRRENVCQTLNIEAPETSFADILQRLVRRYLFKLERLKEESGKDGVNMVSDSLLGATAEAFPTRIREEEPVYADSDETGDTDSSNYAIPPPPPPPQTDTTQRPNWKRRLSVRQGNTLNSSARRRRTSMATGHPQVPDVISQVFLYRLRYKSRGLLPSNKVVRVYKMAVA
ncbi:hypothetical protein NP493_410g05010 [Ridgeia piscesae]|uniref:Transient receptor ion channel domain-containing protein n=1 Tax=Ridgeia piscesae TaxID=27915 RepID=A0AAD9L0J7_RIDPI|nr:hypothetical protein NP493_410g05010 [Ridgeia piscesae]